MHAVQLGFGCGLYLSRRKESELEKADVSDVCVFEQETVASKLVINYSNFTHAK